MQEAVKCDLSGLTGFFKNPDLNTANKDTWYSFPHIHKVAIGGIIGAMQGWNGRQQDMFNPEFWNKFKDFKIAIVPSQPSFKTTKMYCTNTDGYANNNHNVGPSTQEYVEHWLVGKKDKPLKWTVYIENNSSEEFKTIANALLDNTSEYPLYLGNNTHFCDISNAKMVELKKSDADRVHSIIPKNVTLEERAGRYKEKRMFYQYSAPIALEGGYYVYSQHIITNLKVLNEEIFTDGENNIILF